MRDGGNLGQPRSPGGAGQRAEDTSMIDFSLSPEMELLTATVRRFVETELWPLEVEVEETGRPARSRRSHAPSASTR
jgi:hypothetical protein